MPQHIANHMKSELKQLQNHIDDMMALYNSIWYYNLSCKIYDMNMSSRVSGECIYILKDRKKAHNKMTENINTKK